MKRGKQGDGHPPRCPSCNADLRGDPIPHAYRKAYGNKTHFSRVIWIYSMMRDSGVAYLCPDCEHEWAIPGRESWFAERH